MILSVIVGAVDDPHVQAVLERTDCRVVVLDAASLSKIPYAFRDRGLTLPDTEGKLVTISPDSDIRGWIRRIAPADWMMGVSGESQIAAIKASWLTLLTAIIRTTGVHWLSNIDEIVRAENKLVVDACARELAIPMPRTVVSNQVECLQDFATDAIVKPLGPGHFIEEEDSFTVFAQTVKIQDLKLHDLSVSPFLFQERLLALRHFRIVTVKDIISGATLENEGLPDDWRMAPEAHSSFKAREIPESLGVMAKSVASNLGLGYSSQDWVETTDGYFLLDVNPGGQWLFLPAPCSEPVSSEIARWLNER
ncbi:ATP-grasp domain-containing protein [Glutamicibacter halophytocola]|uniref:ATP-grasp domain-containing protein n=1 Tax=Glutamicibacter halophytocola TaxID=1933880 RepID=UPI0015C54147|nr:hypothetical protein [Glutamicibacter halophytocola]NQD42287.1 hypothetical protein [Glutamicibacter halophytocola]